MKKFDVTYMFSDPAEARLDDVYAGKAPRERFQGIVQLRERGWVARISDGQWAGRLAPLRMRMRRWIEFPSFKTISDIFWSRNLVIQGRTAPLISMIARVFRTRVVYVDVIFRLPTRRLRRLENKLSLSLAYATVCFSSSQADLWSSALGIDRKKLVSARWPMDSAFYVRPDYEETSDFVLAVGRDLGRDFDTLVHAASRLGIGVKMVTLPYLVPASSDIYRDVEVLEHLSYRDLFGLYARARVAIIALKDDVTYPSGTRATLEAMLLGTPVVVTSTPALREEFQDEQHVLFVRPTDAEDMAEKIGRVIQDRHFAERLAANAREKVCRDFTTDQFADCLENLLFKPVTKQQGGVDEVQA